MTYTALFDGVLESTTNPNGLSHQTPSSPPGNFEALIGFLDCTTTAKAELTAWATTPGAAIVFVPGQIEEALYDKDSNTIRLRPDVYGNATFSAADWVNVIAHEVKHALNYVAPSSSDDYLTRGVNGLNHETLALGIIANNRGQTTFIS